MERKDGFYFLEMECFKKINFCQRLFYVSDSCFYRFMLYVIFFWTNHIYRHSAIQAEVKYFSDNFRLGTSARNLEFIFIACKYI